MDPEEISKVTPFEELIPYYPLKRILLEDPDVQKDVSMRAVDILTPIGFGQRGLIVAPPRTGKTILLQNIANSISENSPEAKLILLLVDERPEEVTDFRRHTKGEVVSSTFDEAPESHVHCAEMVGEKARAPGGAGRARRHPARLDHPAGPRLQRARVQRRQDHVRRSRGHARCRSPSASSARRATSREAAA